MEDSTIWHIWTVYMNWGSVAYASFFQKKLNNELVICENTLSCFALEFCKAKKEDISVVLNVVPFHICSYTNAWLKDL